MTKHNDCRSIDSCWWGNNTRRMHQANTSCVSQHHVLKEQLTQSSRCPCKWMPGSRQRTSTQSWWMFAACRPHCRMLLHSKGQAAHHKPSLASRQSTHKLQSGQNPHSCHGCCTQCPSTASRLSSASRQGQSVAAPWAAPVQLPCSLWLCHTELHSILLLGTE